MIGRGINRRRFLYAGLAPTLLAQRPPAAPSLLDPSRLPKFVDCLPVPPRAASVGSAPHPHHAAAQIPHYRLRMQEIYTRVHRDLPATRFWGFESSSPGPIIEARRDEPFWIEWINNLPERHFLPLDYSLAGGGRNVPDVRTIIHLHGGRVPPASDGYPERWFAKGGSLLSFYPNVQEATMLWYHDHAMATTRLNIFAGLFGFYLIRDSFEDSLALPKGKYEIPLAICDRSLRADGQLYYPVSGNRSQPWISEFFGQAILVNGKLFPFCEVEPRLYRLRILNASNSRFYYLALSPEAPLWQIGSDQGLLPAPVALQQLTIAPAERADILVDFSACANRQLVLKTDTHALMQFRVSAHATGSAALPKKLRPFHPISESEAVRTRTLSLDDANDADDPTAKLQPMLLNGSYWRDPVTENPTLNTVEIWSLVNTTDDSHPIHLHLVRFQILDRRPFDVFTYLNERELRFTGPPIPPEPNEAGWKDTVRADPGMVSRIIIRFEGFAGRYVWHCHILEHEDNEMMRPYDVLPPQA